MKTKINIIKKLEKDKIFIDEAANVIKDGGLVVFPTETVYGLGANALDSEAVKKIFIAKGRPQDNPLIIHIADKDDLYKYGKNVSKIEPCFKYWNYNGIVTIDSENQNYMIEDNTLYTKDKKTLVRVLKNIHETYSVKKGVEVIGESAFMVQSNINRIVIPDVTSANLSTIGIRMPSDEVAREFIKKSNVAIAAPSANISGRPSPTDVKRCIEDLDGRVDYILGCNESEVGVESTIVDVSVYPPCVLRPGGITLEMLKEVCQDIYMDKGIIGKDANIKPKAPGMKYTHYSPKARVRVVDGNLDKCVEKINEMVHNYIEKGLRVGVMATDETRNEYKEGLVLSLGTRNDVSTIAKSLFSTLREFDDKHVDIIISEAFMEEGLGVAIMNRLKKACGFDIVKII